MAYNGTKSPWGELGGLPRIIRCELCGKMFRMRFEFRRHYARHRRGKKK